MFRILRGIFLSFATTIWWWLALVAFAVGYTAIVRADHPETNKIRAALDKNFEAYNREDMKELMASVSPFMPRRAEFEFQSRKFFESNDAYISVKEFELLAVRLPYAAARVVQTTTKAPDAPEPTAEEAFYRDSTKLLPADEEVEYIQTFKKERGKWRLWLIIPQPQNDCPTGNCGFPRMRVSGR